MTCGMTSHDQKKAVNVSTVWVRALRVSAHDEQHKLACFPEAMAQHCAGWVVQT